MSEIQKLRDAKTLEDVANLLGFAPKSLSYILYKIPESHKYTAFEIPKRSGGKRQVKAPEPRLALLQRRLANFLYSCTEELKNGSPPARRSLAHGFERGRSILSNANLHKRRRYVLNLDLHDFFPSINFGRVRGFFLKDKHFQCDSKVATIIAQIACHDNALPQGSPCSPIISNLVGHLLDSRLARLAKIHKCTYSRYADDITFSTNRKEFPSALAFPVPETKSDWQVGDELRRKIEHSGFEVNEKKTRMQFRDSRQLTTGIMVNEKVNIRQEYWRLARQMAHSLFTKGTYHRKVPAALMGGGSSDPPVKEQLTSLGVLEGVLAHINQVKEYGDLRNTNERKNNPSSARKLYELFLFYKNFIALDRPVIVPEGKTDIIYLRGAIRRLTLFHPRLATMNGGRFESNIRLMNFSSNIHELLRLGRGASQLKSFIEGYQKTVSRFGHTPLGHPVIVVVDNDDGGKSLFPLVRAKTGRMIDFSSTDSFYYIGMNLYFVKTPEAPADPHTSYMEAFFDSSVLSTVLDGKTFDAAKEHDAPGKYGKQVFAARVVEPNVDKIDFSAFTPLLHRIVAVLDHHAALKATVIPAAPTVTATAT